MKNGKTIRYFSMFTGVGGFELGIERANDTQKARRYGQEENLSKQGSGDISSQSDIGQHSISCVGFSEIDKYANELLAKRFPNILNFGDCTKIEADKLPDFDMLCGGFPCQSFSIAGKRRGFQDTRGTMFFEIARILEVKRPKIVLLENVKGLLNHNKGETFRVIIQTLSELGYDVQWMVLNSKFFGVPQNRERVFIIGSLRGTSRPEILPFRRINTKIDEQSKTTRQIIQIDDVARENKNKLGDRLKMDGTSFTLNSIEQRGIIENPETILDINQAQRVYSTKGQSITLKGLGGGQGAKTGLYAIQPVQLVNKNRAEKPYNPNNREMKFKIRDDETSYTVKQASHEFMVAIPDEVVIMDLYNNKEHSDRTPTLTEPHHNSLRLREGMKIRKLTPIECERLQGFPDNWTEGFSDSQRYKMMGNAVTVNVIKAIVRKL